MNEIIKVENLNFSYKEKPILKNISFSVKKGEIVGILGPNGSGKSTLLRCLNALLEADGDIFVNSKNIKNLKQKELAKIIAFLPQESNFHFPLKVFEMVLMGRNPHINFLNLPSKKDIQAALNAIKFIGITHLQNSLYPSLSGGQKKLVLIARAIAQNTDILLLDEPTNHLDFKNQYEILKKIKEISRKKTITSIITFHNPNQAYKYCDKILLLKNGKILLYGNTKEVLTRENLKKIYNTDIKTIKTQEEIFFTI